LSADPFVIHINDCHDCDFEAYPTDLTKLDLAEKMVALKSLAKTDALNRAQIYHELGNAYYNISYWGNAGMRWTITAAMVVKHIMWVKMRVTIITITTSMI
jgi:hypothetical protein